MKEKINYAFVESTVHTNCTTCPFHVILPDPDPDDWFNDDDMKVLCKKTNSYITRSCRPYNLEIECTIPNTCPFVPKNQFETVKAYAINAHAQRNLLYDNKPYSFHLDMVYEFAKKYIYLIPEDKRNIVLMSSYTHDLLEDTGKTYNDIKKIAGTEVAEITRALTNDVRGRTREERMSQQVYNDIRNTPHAIFVKLCDRLANTTHSLNTKSRMYKVYQDEHGHFTHELFRQEYTIMFDELKQILGR